MTIALNNDSLQFEFPEVHPDAKFSIEFQRTLRIPDDGKPYPLPPGLGKFPIKRTEDFKDRIPASWVEHQGVMLPMYQSEALWLNFSRRTAQSRPSAYPFAVKIAAGKRCAISGEAWWPKLRSGTEQDYVVVPKQPWLDGFVVEKGKIRQFVAVPLGMGLTVESQLDGKEEFGGIQIQVYPMKADVFERRFPKIVLEHVTDSQYRKGVCPIAAKAKMDCRYERGLEMGLGAGGMMKQEVYKDPFDPSDWDMEHTSRVYVHLANSLVWKAITQHDPPYPPPTSADYTRKGLPWFDYYADDLKALAGTGLLKNINSVLQMGFQKGLEGVLPENESHSVETDKIHIQNGNIREGIW